MTQMIERGRDVDGAHFGWARARVAGEHGTDPVSAQLPSVVPRAAERAV